MNFDKDELFKWSLKVRKRDGRCIRCGSIKYLEAHHILAKNEYPKYAYKVRNGATLCIKCHRLDDDSYHKLYGYTNTSKKKFYKWLKATYKRDKRNFRLTFYLFLFIVFIVFALMFTFYFF